MKVGELLDAYPDLESVLVAQAPAFAKLRNPVLRRTVARVATLQQASLVGGIETRALVLALRRAAGQRCEEAGTPPAEVDVTEAYAPVKPSWVREEWVACVLDADALLAEGRVPLPVAIEEARSLGAGQLLRVDASFRPAPLVDALGRQGYRCWVREPVSQRFEAFVGPAS